MNYRKLGRTSSQRKATLRDLTTDLLINECIVTTEVHAKEVRSTTEKMIILGKRGGSHACRRAAAFVRNEVASMREESEDIVIESALQRLFNNITPRYAERQDGCIRISKTEPRRDGGTLMVVLGLV